jgi:hypothetical protein
MTATPTTPWMRLVRRLGLDRNPLRRRSDVVAAWLLPAAVVAFLALCPLVYGLTGMRVRADNAVQQRADLSGRMVTAVLLQAAPGAAQSDNGANTWTVWTRARWTFGGRPRTGYVPVTSGTSAGARVLVYLDRSGRVQPLPLTRAELSDRVVADSSYCMAAITVMLAGLAFLASRVLDRRRLAGWQTEWLAVGPRWSRQA